MSMQSLVTSNRSANGSGDVDISARGIFNDRILKLSKSVGETYLQLTKLQIKDKEHASPRAKRLVDQMRDDASRGRAYYGGTAEGSGGFQSQSVDELRIDDRNRVSNDNSFLNSFVKFRCDGGKMIIDSQNKPKDHSETTVKSLASDLFKLNRLLSPDAVNTGFAMITRTDATTVTGKQRRTDDEISREYLHDFFNNPQGQHPRKYTLGITRSVIGASLEDAEDSGYDSEGLGDRMSRFFLEALPTVIKYEESGTQPPDADSATGKATPTHGLTSTITDETDPGAELANRSEGMDSPKSGGSLDLSDGSAATSIELHLSNVAASSDCARSTMIKL